MKTITYIKDTAFTPKIAVNVNGKISITGKSIMHDPQTFYQPLHEMVWALKTNHVVFDLQIEEINFESTRQLIQLFELAKVNPWVDTLKVYWEYDFFTESEIDPSHDFDYVLGSPSGNKKLD